MILENAFKKIFWRISYLARWCGVPLLSPLIPARIRRIFGFEYPFLQALPKKCSALKMRIAKTDGGYRLTMPPFSFLLPARGFAEGDFFDIAYPFVSSCAFAQNVIRTMDCDGPYERAGAFLSEGDYVVDAGANIGLFSVVASKKVGMRGAVFACEPIEDVLFYLRDAVEHNRCTNVSILPYAVGETEAVVSFNVALGDNFEGSSKYFHAHGEKRVSVQQKRLDDLVDRGIIARVDFIKADIEGAERDLLMGAWKTIKQFKPKMALRTYHRPDDPEVLRAALKKIVPEYHILQEKKTLYAWIEA
ncbi:MAG: FkbM family methyltransferase [Candidatus Paceibacterota bacterium]|jgi:FkbM family methyltransferase